MLPNREELHWLLSALIGDLTAFAPELAIVAGILCLLFARLIPRFDRWHLGPLAIAAVVAALGIVFANWDYDGPRTAFSGLLNIDRLADFIRAIVLLSTLFVLILTWLTGVPDAEDSADFCVLLLGSALGMMLMASANHLLIVFLAIEMASLPSYALAGFLKGRRTGSEAALKYVVFGAAAAGVMLYGISLLAGSFGTGSLPIIAAEYGRSLANGTYPIAPTAGLILLLVGFAFKLAAVPAHFWLPDVFEGAMAEVGAFLSVASKAAAVGLLARILVTFQTGAAGAGVDSLELMHTFGVGLVILGAITAMFGNLAALPQTNLKRLLAYSTIAHAGYMLMGLAVIHRGMVPVLLVYLAAYLLMNTGAFAVVALVRHHTGSESLDAFRGLIRRSPALGMGFTVFLLSLLGLPPLAGFVGKFLLFTLIYDMGTHCLAFRVAFVVALLNTVLSAGYYLKVLRVIGLDEPTERDESGEVRPLGESWLAAAFVVTLAVATVIVGIAWNPLFNAAAQAINR